MQDDLNLTEAAKTLGITRVTLEQLVREGRLPTTEHPLDKRQQLIPRRSIEQLMTQVNNGTVGLRARTAGALSDTELRSDELEDYMAGALEA